MNEVGLRRWLSPSRPSNGLLEDACDPIAATSEVTVIDWLSAILAEEGRCQNHLLHDWGMLVLSISRIQRTFELLQASQDRRRLPVLLSPKRAAREAVVLSIATYRQLQSQKRDCSAVKSSLCSFTSVLQGLPARFQ